MIFQKAFVVIHKLKHHNMKALGIFGTMDLQTQCHLKILNDYFKTKNYSSELCLGTKRSGAELFW